MSLPKELQALLQPEVREGANAQIVTKIMSDFVASKDLVARQVGEVKRDFGVEFTAPEVEKVNKDIKEGVLLWLSTGSPHLLAALIGEPIVKVPEYKPLYPLLLKGSTRDINDREAIEYEDEVEVGEAIYFDPNGKIKRAHIKGNKHEIYPRWIRTKDYAISITEWLQRLISIILIKKKQLSQELDKKIDRDLIALFDASVPASHKVDCPGGKLTFEKLTDAVKKLTQITSTKVVHKFAVANIVIGQDEMWDITRWGKDYFTEETNEKFTMQGITGKIKLVNAALIENPLVNDSKVRIFPAPAQTGYFITMTIEGKKRLTWGQTNSWQESLKTNQPHSFSMNCGALQCFAMEMVNANGLAQVAVTT